MTILTIANQKAGSARPPPPLTLAHGLARRGKRTLLLDFDPQGQAARALHLSPRRHSMPCYDGHRFQ
ncbi:MAG: AAA family ATPase [Anaerolineales bacterium]|nr:AAA family ATPase [Anaerolineales bacterium]